MNNNPNKPATDLFSEGLATDITVNADFKHNNKEPTLGLLKAKIDLYEDCDDDCRKYGSRMTPSAILLGVAYGIIGLNSLFMLIGAWRWRWRVCSLYCTIFACLFQFAILITTGVFLMTKYNAVCGRSMAKTAGDAFPWTMVDDFKMTFSLWVGSFFVMFGFLCCGLCSAWDGKCE